MVIKNRNLFRISRFLILKISPLFKFLSKCRLPQKRLLIIKIDAIGDYVLFRNYIEIIKNSALYRNFEIDLLGNAIWQDIAIKFDNAYISNFIFINPDELYEQPGNLFKLAWRLFNSRYETVFHPTYSRTFIADGLAAFTAAKNIIGFAGNNERIRENYKAKSDKFYTRLLDCPSSIYNEFERSRFFCETALSEKITIKNPEIPFDGTRGGYVIIFPGSGVIKRSWEPDKFLALILIILQKTNRLIYLAGGDKEADLCYYLAANLLSERVVNLAGKTSLTQLTDLIAGAALLISNETSAVHIASAVKTESICILGGGHFNRFLPYQMVSENNPRCVYNEMDCYNCNWHCKYTTNTNEPYPCIATISVENVWAETQKLIATETN